MKAWRRWIPLLAALGLLVLAFAGLFRLRLGGGDLYPPYSSLRADALGTRAFYEALEQIPGIAVERDFRPLGKLSARPRLVLMPGLAWQQWREVPVDQLAALNAAAGSGARLVLGFMADQKREDRDEKGRKHPETEAERTEEAKKAEKREKAKKDAEKRAKKSKQPGVKEVELKELAKEWGVTLNQRWLVAKEFGVQKADAAPSELPAGVAWQSDLYFSVSADSEWRVLYRRAGEAVLIEKTVGRGSIVLLADAYCLSNEAMHRDRATALLSWLVGDYRRVVFMEGSLGVIQEKGIGFLARRYGLGGAMFLAVILGGLYAWRRVVAFKPSQEVMAADGTELVAYEPAAGITALLRRSLGASDLLRVCVEEWRKGQRQRGGNHAAAARLDAALHTQDPKKSLSSNYNALARSLKPR